MAMNKGFSYDDVVQECQDAGIEVKRGCVALYKYEPQEVTKGGIVLPDEAQQIPICGKVILDRTDEGFPPGSTVYFRAYSDVNIPLGIYGEPPFVTVVHEKDIMLERRGDA